MITKVVTPKILAGSKTPNCFIVSATIGTVEFTGLEITAIKAVGQYFAQPIANFLTIPAFYRQK
jgi:hypothetical protein